VNGGLQITRDLLISGSTQMVGNTVFDNIIVNGLSRFEGIATLNSTFAIEGNIDSKSNINVANNIVCGNVLYFNNESQFIYADPSGIGINKMNPDAALDISTNCVNGILIQSSQPVSTSTLIQNNNNQGILLYGNTTTEYIDFFNETPLSSESVGDARLSYTKGGIFELDVSQNINLMSNITVSNRGSQPHLFNETVIIYDTSNGPFFGNIYAKPITSGSALTLVSSDNTSNTFLHISTPSGEGLAIGGGIYSNDITRSSGFIGLTDSSGQLITTQNIVSGSDPVKYKSTIGINTFQPLTEKYVVDINGPVHINNSDITTIQQKIPFEIYSMSISKNNRNKIIALGSSYDISLQPGFQRFREKIIISNDYGSTWSQIDISNGLLNLKTDPKFTNIYTYDNSYAFISGTNNTLFFSINGGYTWNNIVTGLPNNTFNNIQIGNSSVAGNNILYFSANNILYSYDFSFNTLNMETESITVTNNITTSLVPINSITTNSNYVFLAGSSIAKYNSNNWSLINQHTNSSNISYNEIHSYNNTIIAVGNGIISSSRNNGSSWTDIYLNGIQFNSIFCNDVSNAIVVGSQGNLWTSQDGGITWSLLPDSLLNTSGKKWMITDPSNILQNVVMSDANTLIVSNILIPYIQGSQYGSSELINIFIPNFINRTNNHILDVCGNMRISGDIRINDGGSLQSNNNTFSILDTSVQNITVGANTNSIILGGISTGITGNLLVGKNTTINGNLAVISDTSHIGNVQISHDSNLITSHIIPNTDNIIKIGDNGTNAYQINIGGPNDNITFQGQVIYEAPAFNNSKTIVVNANNQNQFASSAGSGLNIYDNKGLPPPYNPINAGYMHIGNDLQSFVFKAPNINQSGNPISGNNIVRLGVNSLTLQNPNIINGLVVLQKDQTYHNTQEATHTSFGGYDNNDNEANYAIVSVNFDISNIMLKQIDSITGSQIVETNLIIGNLTTNNNLSIYGNLTTLADTSFNGNLRVGRNLSINGYSNFVSDVSMNGNLVINRNTLIYGNLTSLSDSSFNGNLRVGRNLSINGYSSFLSDVSMNGNLVINRNTLIYGNLTGLSDSSFNGNLRVGGNVFVNGYSSFFSDVSMNGNLIINRNTLIYGNLTGLSDSSFNGNLRVGSNVFVNGYSSFFSDVSMNGNLVVNRNTLIYGNLTGLSDSSFNGNLRVGGNVLVNGYSNFVSDVSLNGNLVVNRNTLIYGNITGLSDSSFNGNLRVGGNVFVNGYSNFVSDVSMNGNLVINRNTLIYGNITGLSDSSFNGNLRVGGNVFVNGYSNFVSDVSMNGNLVINRNTLIYGNITGLSDSSFNGNLRIGCNVFVNGYSSFFSDVSMNGNLVVNRNTLIYGNITGLSDTSLNGNLIIGKKVGIGISNPNGKLHIYESTTSTSESATSGSLVIEHGNDGGVSSIIFPSKKNNNNDYGYIRYRDDVNNSTSGEQGRLEIGTENESGAAGSNNDALILQKNGGYLGIGTNNPMYTLDVNGIINTNTTITCTSSGAANTGFLRFTSSTSANFIQSGLTNTGGSVAPLYFTAINASNTWMTINSAGNVGIGTTNPVYTLDVNGTLNVSTSIRTILPANTGVDTKHNILISTADSSTSGLITYDGDIWYNPNVNLLKVSNIVIGAESKTSGYVLDVNGALRIYEATGTGDSITGTVGSLVIEHGNNGGVSSIIFPSKYNRSSDYGYIRYRDDVNNNASGEQGRLEIGTENDIGPAAGVIDSLILQKNGGYVGVGNNNPKYTLDVSGAVQATSYNATSDYRLKENIIPISHTDFSIDLLKPVYYSLKDSQKKDLGFLAHEVQAELPFLVSGEKDGENMQSINYNGFIALLVKEIQELKKEMKVLKERVGDLEKGSEIDLS